MKRVGAIRDAIAPKLFIGGMVAVGAGIFLGHTLLYIGFAMWVAGLMLLWD